MYNNYLSKLSHKIRQVNINNGWTVLEVRNPGRWQEDPHHIPALLALVHSEISEALEAFRVRDFASFTEELADVIIRVLDLTAALDIDIQRAIERKVDINKTRGFRHGGKLL